jgi:hypothetical protein
MVIALVCRLVKDQRAKRVLVITFHSAVREALARRLSDWTEMVPVKTITKPRFREFEAGVKVGASPWGRPVIAVMTARTATRRDVQSSLFTVEWDTVVIEEAQDLSPEQLDLARRLVEAGSAARLLLVSEFLRDTAGVALTPAPALTRWPSGLTDLSGTPLVPDRQKEIVAYQRDPAEVDFLHLLREAYADTKQSKSIQRLASSSLYAIEHSLRRQRNRLAHGAPSAAIWAEEQEEKLGGESEMEELDESSLFAPPAGDRSSVGANLPRIEWLIDQIETIPTDQKLDALKGLIDAIEEQGAKNVCVLSCFASTVSYLHSSLAGLYDGRNIYQATSSARFDARAKTVRRFNQSGGTIVLSSATVVGLDLESVDVAISYDLPRSARQMARRWALLARSSSSETSVMYAFKDTSGAIPLESELLRRHSFE